MYAVRAEQTRKPQDNPNGYEYQQETEIVYCQNRSRGGYPNGEHLMINLNFQLKYAAQIADSSHSLIEIAFLLRLGTCSGSARSEKSLARLNRLVIHFIEQLQ